MNPETKEKLNEQTETAKKKAFGAAAWCKERIVAAWRSGPKGKAVCVGGVLVLLLAIGMLGGGEKRQPQLDAPDSPPTQVVAESREDGAGWNADWPEDDDSLAQAYADRLAQEAEAAMQQRRDEAQAREDEHRAEMERRRAEEEARRKEMAAQEERDRQLVIEKVKAQQQAIQDAENHVPMATGDLAASALSEKEFSDVFIGDPPDDEGTIYAHGRSGNIQVLQSTSSGLLVGYVQGTSQYISQVENLMENFGVSFDRVVWVDTKTRLNEENRPLREGFYVRKGMHSHVGVDGGEHVLAQYIEITNPKDVEMLKAELKRRAEEKRIAEEEAAELADERGAYNLNIPIKSLCGFKLGAPPSQVKGLLLHEDGTPVRVLSYRSYMYGHKEKYRLAKPFRLFTHVEVEFADNGFGKHLREVVLEGKPDLNKITEESYLREVEATAQLIEKKFGIRFQREYSS